LLDNWGNGGVNFTRTVAFDKLASVMTAVQVEQQRAAGLLLELANQTGFTLLAPPPDETRGVPPTKHTESAAQAVKSGELRTDIEAMRATVKAGVQVVTAPQLFPTMRDAAVPCNLPCIASRVKQPLCDNVLHVLEPPWTPP